MSPSRERIRRSEESGCRRSSGTAGGCECAACEGKFRAQRFAGNQAMQRRALERDPDEAAADAAAKRIAPSVPALREAEHNGAPQGGGQLPEPLNRHFSPHFGFDFSGVRVRHDAIAAAEARALNARAFTFGSEIVFGDGQYAPETAQGRELLAHELAHVVQQSEASEPAIQRQPDDKPATPCPFERKDIKSLSDDELLAEIRNVTSCKSSTFENDPHYCERKNYAQLLTDRRVQRIREGQLWMGDEHLTADPVLYQLVPGDGGTEVILADRSSRPTGPGVTVITANQLTQALLKGGIPNLTRNQTALQVCLMDPSERLPWDPTLATAGTVGGLFNVPPFEAQLPSVFAQPANPWTLARGWTGAVGEYAASSFLPGAEDLNVRPWTYVNQAGNVVSTTGNFPIYDFATNTALLQVKTSGSLMPQTRMTLAESGLFDIFGGSTATRQATFANAVQNLFPNVPAAQARQEALARGQLAIVAEDVPLFRQYLHTEMLASPNDYRVVIDALLELQPETVGGVQVTSLSQAQSNLTGGQLNVLLDRLATRAGERVIANIPLKDPAMVGRLRTMRSGFGLGAASAPEGVIAEQAFPELFMTRARGGGPAGMARGIGVGGLRSAGFGGAAGGGLDVLASLIFRGELPSQREFFGTVASTSVGSGTGGAIETWAAARMAETGIAQNLSGRAFTAATRARAGGAGGGIAAPLTAGLMEYLTNPNATKTDIIAKSGRAVVPGAASGAFAAGLTGAIWGSQVPIVGNVVGFIVGVAVYYIVDSVVGQAIENAIRELVWYLDFLSKSPGSMFAGGMVTPYVMRGGFAGLLENPASSMRKKDPCWRY